MPRTQEQYDKIREQRKLMIMEKAMELFAREGFGHVSVSMLAKEAGISKGLMYNYFESKDHLLKEIITVGIDRIMVAFDPNHDGVLTRAEFELFIRKTFLMMREEGDFFKNFFSIVIQPNVKEHLKESAMVDFMLQYFEVFVAYFKDLGFEDPLMEVFQLSVMIEGFGIMMLFYDDLNKLPEDLFKKLEERIIKTYT